MTKCSAPGNAPSAVPQSVCADFKIFHLKSCTAARTAIRLDHPGVSPTVGTMKGAAETELQVRVQQQQ
jgi:hypothetical protein